MQIVVLFISTSLVFLFADAVMLNLVLQPLFQQHLGAQLLDGFRLIPALLFYVSYVGGVLWFAAWPALKNERPGQAAVNGAILGAVAYGCFELTSMTIMANWHPSMVAVDWAWGTVLTGSTAWAGVQITRALIRR